MIDAYPLEWPLGYSRTPSHERTWSRFKQSMDKAQRFLHDEISRMSGKGLIVSTNIPVRRDGMLYADWMNRKIDDPGVAIYFKYKDKDVTMCCDKYLKIWENIYALARTIEAMRQIERDGVSDFIDRSFTGFKALPESSISVKMDWWDILNVPMASDKIKEAHRKLVIYYHPDNPATGNTEKFIQIQKAYEAAMQNL